MRLEELKIGGTIKGPSGTLYWVWDVSDGRATLHRVGTRLDNGNERLTVDTIALFRFESSEEQIPMKNPEHPVGAFEFFREPAVHRHGKLAGEINER